MRELSPVRRLVTEGETTTPPSKIGSEEPIFATSPDKGRLWRAYRKFQEVNPMTDSQNQALALLRCAFWGEPMPQIADLEAVKQELRHQAALTLTADALADRASIREAANRLTHYYAMLDAQTQMLRLLEENAIPAVVLKGTAAAMYYPKPGYRKLGDVDLLIPPSHYEAALTAIRAAGYAEYLDKDRHMGFSAGIIRFEVHRYFSEAGDEPLDALLYDAISRREIHDLEGYAFPALPPLENGIVLLQHLAQHLKGSPGLRQLIDWMFYCKAHLTDDYYETVFAPAIRPLGLEKLAITATRLCQLYLGLPGDFRWCAAGDEALGDAILEQMFSRGIFGSKDSHGAGAVAALNRTPLEFLRALQHNGCARWKLLEKCPFLKPFAWLYQLFYLAGQVLGQKNPLSRLKADRTAAKQQRRLLKALDLD